MTKKITVLGHRNQDTDATVAAIGLAELLTKAGLFKATAKIADAPNKETIYVLKRFAMKKPSSYKPRAGEAVFFVDFNEETQSPISFKDAQIEGLVDHHKLNVNFSKEYPILFRVEPVGSSSTIVTKLFNDYRVAIEKKTAGLLLSGIVSDTLKFSSPTTTREDILIGKKLARIAGVTIDSLASDMFAAKSDLRGMKGKDLITVDYKEFTFGVHKTGIGVLETVDPSSPLKMEREILQALAAYKKERGLDLIFFGVVDIIKQNTTLILVDTAEEDAASRVFKRKAANQILELPGVVSRKKQIVPAFTKYLT